MMGEEIERKTCVSSCSCLDQCAEPIATDPTATDPLGVLEPAEPRLFKL